jgi:aminoglycoside/choline kinase family phosphotransferase
MTDNGHVPAGPGDITPEWLTGALRQGGHLSDGAVTAVSIEQIGADRGFTGVIARVKPTYSSADPAPESLVVKLPTAERQTPSSWVLRQGTDGEASRRRYEHCVNEVAFYRDLAVGQVPAPAVYYAATDVEQLRAVILLEDLSAGTAGDNLAGCTPAQASAVVEAVAPLHARMWQQPAPTWVPPFVRDPQQSQRRYAAMVDPFLDRYGDTLPSWVPGLLRRLQSNYATVLAELNRAPRTLLHGDLHLDNVMFFDGADNGRPVVVLDWQNVRYGPAAIDVVRAVHTSLDADDRRQVEQDLMTRYVALLEEHGVQGYAVHQLRHHVRLALLRLVAGTVGWLTNADADLLTGREEALLAAAFGDGRLLSALQDHNLT